MTDLSLVSFDELWNELCKRHDSCIYAYIKGLNAEKEEMQGNYHGGKASAIGLAEYMKHIVLNDICCKEEDNN